MKILGSMEIPMSKKDQRKIGKFFQKAADRAEVAAVICDPRVFQRDLPGVWREKPEWKMAVIDVDLYDKINRLLHESMVQKNHERIHKGTDR